MPYLYEDVPIADVQYTKQVTVTLIFTFVNPGHGERAWFRDGMYNSSIFALE